MVIELYPNLKMYEIRENKGSMAYNRLAMQLSFAMWKIFELYKNSTFTITLDCIDDVVVFKLSDERPNITTYQIKTKDNNAGNFELKSLTGKGVFKKLYDHIEKIDDDVKEVILVSNLSLKYKKSIITGENITLNSIEDSIKEIIVEDMSQNSTFGTKGFSNKIKFSQIDMSIQNHIDISKNKFNDLLINQEIDISLVTANALFNTLSHILHTRQCHEFSIQDSILTILPRKSFTSDEFEKLIEDARSTRELIQYQDIVNNYKNEKLKLIEESQYKQALATFKDKVATSPNIMANLMNKGIDSAKRRIGEGSETRCQILKELIVEFDDEFSEIYFSEKEIEILLMNCIERAIEEGGIN
ncbi:dsDNA nuclease domain-containing protein [Priestia flexa]|uniref:dsDNA nuclease domain-containing protein n=1 Tax=Priestia flexa TaxID=86664 RepID=UPI002E21B8AD|nr:dsDNA nuclease domain-containing protein [Priestia flexa]MED3824338.1 dsDNA nuclease domain-containing protein [Priestia flexa]